MEYVNGGLPVIDFEDFPNQSSKLIKACEEWGCFRLINHHKVLPAPLMADMKEVIRSLLDLPVEIKKCNEPVDSLPYSGYFPTGPWNPLTEALTLYDTSCVEDIGDFCAKLHASPHQRETMVKYAAAMHELMQNIMQKICEGLGLTSVSNFEEWPCPCQFRFNKYIFTPETIGSMGSSQHTDTYFLAILQDDENVRGLEVLKKSGEYVAVEPWPNGLFVNMGDMTRAWSNGRFCNVKHRVICKEGKTRVSIVATILGHLNTVVEPPLELVDDENPRLYVPFTRDELANLRISTNTYAGEALELLRTNL